VSSSRINLTWADNANNEAGFKIERSTNGGVSFTQIAVAPANYTTYANMNLAAGTAYTYRVRAYEGPNNSAYSNTAAATTQGAPAAPSNLTAAAFSSSRIDLTWTDNATNEAGFKVETSTDGVNFTRAGVLAANVTAWSHNFLSPGSTHTYRIRAYEGTNHSAYSNTASATTLGAPPAPSNLTATAVTPSRIDLQWTDNSGSESGFRIERSTDGVNFTQVALAMANQVTYSNTGLTADTAYRYRVQAYEGSNNSAYSNTATATTLPPPNAPRAQRRPPAGRGG
jgi:hypothetical protein